MMNPYQSPECSARSSRHGNVLDRVCWALLGAVAGGLAGRFAGWFVWNFIYGIGSRVISDDIYEAYVGDVCLWSMVIGSATGVVAGLVLASRLPLVLLGQYGVGVVIGAVSANWGWRCGLGGYFAGQVIGIAVVMACLVLRHVRRDAVPGGSATVMKPIKEVGPDN